MQGILMKICQFTSSKNCSMMIDDLKLLGIGTLKFILLVSIIIFSLALLGFVEILLKRQKR
jgi:hypothetical protein